MHEVRRIRYNANGGLHYAAISLRSVRRTFTRPARYRFYIEISQRGLAKDGVSQEYRYHGVECYTTWRVAKERYLALNKAIRIIFPSAEY